MSVLERTVSLTGHDGAPMEVTEFVLENGNGVTARVISYGAAWCDMRVQDVCGGWDDVCLGFAPEDLQSYVTRNAFLGSTVGRAAGRIPAGEVGIPPVSLDASDAASQIAHLKPCDAAEVNPEAHLHGGPVGFDKVNWSVSGHAATEEGVSVVFTHTSPDGDMGYPGALDVTLTYTLTEGNEMHVVFSANTTKDTLCSLTNHAYFNLAGHNAGPDAMREHSVRVCAEKYIASGESRGVCVGERSVEGTAHDLRESSPVGDVVARVAKSSPEWPYGELYVLEGEGGEEEEEGLNLAAVLAHPPSGRTLHVHTTEPALQTYYANMLAIEGGKEGADYKPFSAFCLEVCYGDSFLMPT